MKYKLEIAYDGTDYSGWQCQPDRISVQQAIEEKLKDLYANQRISIKGAGRTDAGVHALGMTASFYPPNNPIIPQKKLLTAINGILPSSIRITNVSEVDPEFDARFSAVGKAYTYVICKSDPGPFLYKWCYKANKKLNLEKIKTATKTFSWRARFFFFCYIFKQNQKKSCQKNIPN